MNFHQSFTRVTLYLQGYMKLDCFWEPQNESLRNHFVRACHSVPSSNGALILQPRIHLSIHTSLLMRGERKKKKRFCSLGYNASELHFMFCTTQT